MKAHLDPDPNRIVGLDGVRGLAVLLVTAMHLVSSDKYWLTEHLAGSGWIGVDLFFVLSGFLITRILVASRETTRFFSNFYARRALRIWPLYYSLLAFAFVGTLALPTRMHIPLSLFPFYATFTQNLFRPQMVGPWALAGTWSLAIEEQFYLLWPLCIRRLKPRALVVVLLSILICAPFARVIAFERGVPPCAVYIASLLRADSLAAGSLAAILYDSGARIRLLRLARSCGFAVLCLGLLLSITVASNRLVCSEFAVTATNGWVISVTYSSLAIGFAALLVHVTTGQSGVLGQAFASAPLQFFGRISFGLYISQGIAIPMAQELLRPWVAMHFDISNLRVTAIVVFVAGSASIGMALLSWRFLEVPALTLRSRFAAASRG